MTQRTHLLTHPDNMRLIRELLTVGDTETMTVAKYVGGTPLHASRYVNRWVRKWQPPPGRFIEHDASDEPWLRYFGLGREVDTDEPAIWLVNSTSFDMLTRTGRRSIFGSPS